MFSKSSNIIFLIFILLLGSCTPKLGEKPPETAVIQFNSNGCFETAKGHFKNIFLGSAQNSEVAFAFDCVNASIKQFKKYVVGTRNRNSYQPQELASFIEINFFKNETKISTKFQKEFMLLKSVLIGGSAEELTQKELDKLVVFIDQLKKMVIDINPHMKIIMQKWILTKDFDADSKVFEAANKTLFDAAERFATIINKNPVTYRFDDFIHLLKEIENVYGENWTFIASIEKYLPLIKKIKKIIAEGDEETVTPQEWVIVSNVASRGYFQYLRYLYFISPESRYDNSILISYVTKTVEDILGIAQDLVKNKKQQSISKLELIDMMQAVQQIWPDLVFSEKFIDELLIFKKVLLGGRNDQLDFLDFVNAQDKIKKLKSPLENIYKYWNVYTNRWDLNQLDYDQAQNLFQEAEVNLLQSIDSLKFVFQGDYEYDHFLNLIGEFEKTFLLKAESQKSKLSDQLVKLKPVFINYKNLIVGVKSDVISEQEWIPLIRTSAQIYLRVLYAKFFILNLNYSEDELLKSSMLWVESSHHLLVEILGYRSSQLKLSEPSIPREDLVDFVGAFVQADLISAKLKKESIQKTVIFILDYILRNPQVKADEVSSSGLKISHLNYLSQLLYRYADLKKVQIEVLKDFNEVEKNNGMNLLDIRESLKKNLNNNQMTSRQKYLINEFLQIYNTRTPMLFNNDNTLKISKNTSLKLSAQSLQKTALFSFSADLIMQHFSKNQKELLQEDLLIILPLVQGILIDLNIYKSSLSQFIKSRFLDGNIFTPRGDGNTSLSKMELIELIHLIYSGINQYSKFEENMNIVCFKSKEVADASCVAKQFSQHIDTHLSGLPDLLGYKKIALKNKSWNDYLLNNLKTVGYIENQKIDKDTTQLLPHILQYLEMMFWRMDKSKDGFLDDWEVELAFPVFKPLLKDLAKGAVEDSDLLPLFAYIVKKGHPPESLADKLSFMFSWKVKKVGEWKISADRGQLARILGYIADQMSQDPKKAVQIMSQWPTDIN